jgi:hypothetical protein
MISYQTSVSKGWLHQQGKFIFDDLYYQDPLYRRTQDQVIHDFVRKRFQHYPVYHMEANLMQAGYVDENQVLIGGIQPNLILAIVLGAEFVSYPDRDADVKGNPLENGVTIDELPSLEHILNHPYILELDSQIVRIQKDHPELKIIPPFFWDLSGRATIHGILTTSLKLMGDNALLMLITEPERMHIVHQWITDIYTGLIDHFTRLTDFPVTSIHVGECSGTMISGEQYLEFVTPYVSQLGRKFGKVRLHSCGLSDHLLDAISRIEGLSVIDTGSNTSIARIRELMGTDFEINVEPPLRLMLKDAPEEDLSGWLQLTLKENKGGPLKLAMHIEPDYSVERCLTVYDELVKNKLV